MRKTNWPALGLALALVPAYVQAAGAEAGGPRGSDFSADARCSVAVSLPAEGLLGRLPTDLLDRAGSAGFLDVWTGYSSAFATMRQALSECVYRTGSIQKQPTRPELQALLERVRAVAELPAAFEQELRDGKTTEHEAAARMRSLLAEIDAAVSSANAQSR